MMGLWGGIAALTLLALVFIFLPFIRARVQQQLPCAKDRRQQNIDIFKDRLTELERERARGTLCEEAFTQLKLELEKNLLGDVVEVAQKSPVQVGNPQLATVALLALITASASMGIYASLGSYQELNIAQQRQEMRANGRTPTVEEAIATLQDELKVRPDNPEGWYMLATTFMNLGRYMEGADALQQVLNTLPQDTPQYSGIMGQYAQARYFALGNRITPELRQHIDRTLEVDPKEMTTLGLLGIDAFENKQYQVALGYWNQALQTAQGQAAESLRTGISKARQALKEQGGGIASAEPATASLSVKVSLDAGLLSRVSPEQTVFIFARPVDGRMPLAAVKLKVADLPTTITLDDSMAMMPQARLSSVDTVEVNAKVSMSGTPEAAPGDLFGRLSPVSVKGGNTVLRLVIDQVVQ
ncbi:MAG: c-type cytochrome biogenesis protein CcmI [Marinobacterium sp.]|nr:c-type cytochrome biogenesis protein CcmI [Marinobacterium sp.]